MKSSTVSRRDFLRFTALSAGALGARLPLAGKAGVAEGVCLVTDPADPIAAAPAVRWAAQELERSLAQYGITLRRVTSPSQAPRSQLCIVAAGRDASLASSSLKGAGVRLPEGNEALALAPAKLDNRPVLLACGSDARGLTYALLELSDRVQYADNPIQAFKLPKPVVERPCNAVRSIGRLFVSDVEDKPWFNDREMWPAYFAMLAGQRFNRFHLCLGLGYDFLQNVTDAYFLFAYPFLLSVPGYNVRAVNLPDAERDRNLEMLQFISEQAVAHGIDFQLGLWMHAYQWMKSPQPNYTIEGVTPDNHGDYCRDAVSALLKACPHISGVTLRTHGESGVHEGSYAFWKTVFEGVAQSGRKVEIDLHTKGLDQTMIEAALATGLPLRLSPKYWAEHMGMPYHQAAIRETEMPRQSDNSEGFFGLSAGSRSFTRYGYADFLREDRGYSVMFRVWPGTHRMLLWGDPATAAAHARVFTFCGSEGVELFEPLSFKGREGSGLAGGRCAYADRSLQPHWDWQKFLYTYLVWGRLTYNPDTEPDTWRRYLRRQPQSAAPGMEAALASATRILPIVTTAHLPSAANVNYEPEFYTNQSLLDPSKSRPYDDMPSPKIFANVSPLDPQLFSRMSDFAADLLKGERSPKYSPIEVAQWLEDLADTAGRELAKAESFTTEKSSTEFPRIAVDLKIQIGLGRFFAMKFRSGTLYAIHEQSGNRAALEAALKAYKRAREIWAQFAAGAKEAYVSDITIGPKPFMRGHWLDRLPAIDADIADMASRMASVPETSDQSAQIRAAIHEALGRPQRSAVPSAHTPADRFVPGEPLHIVLSVKETVEPITARLYYRHVNQAERYQDMEMQRQGKEYRALIPGNYADGKYALQYYFELRQAPDEAWLYPGFTTGLANQPYFVVRPR